MSNSFGKMFRVTSFGESHGGAVGVVIDGCPPGHKIDLSVVQEFLNRRRPGCGSLSSPRQELDQVSCLSGLDEGVSLGTPIVLLVKNKDVAKGDYDELKKVFRPSHADYSTQLKYGIRPSSGGGRASARETVARVAAAGVAEQILANLVPDLKVLAFVESVGNFRAAPQDPNVLSRSDLDQDPLRCPDKVATKKMTQVILSAKESGDSVGGVICAYALQVPGGLGEPVFDKLEAELARAMMCLPASRGFEIGSGFSAAKMLGSEHNDEFILSDTGEVKTRTNHSGGVQGGISTGEPIVLRVAFKPVASIKKSQTTLSTDLKECQLAGVKGRHDPCVLPRAVPMVEAMFSLVLMDHLLRQLSIEAATGVHACRLG